MFSEEEYLPENKSGISIKAFNDGLFQRVKRKACGIGACDPDKKGKEVFNLINDAMKYHVVCESEEKQRLFIEYEKLLKEALPAAFFSSEKDAMFIGEERLDDYGGHLPVQQSQFDFSEDLMEHYEKGCLSWEALKIGLGGSVVRECAVKGGRKEKIKRTIIGVLHGMASGCISGAGSLRSLVLQVDQHPARSDLVTLIVTLGFSISKADLNVRLLNRLLLLNTYEILSLIKIIEIADENFRGRSLLENTLEPMQKNIFRVVDCILKTDQQWALSKEVLDEVWLCFPGGIRFLESSDFTDALTLCKPYDRLSRKKSLLRGHLQRKVGSFSEPHLRLAQYGTLHPVHTLETESTSLKGEELLVTRYNSLLEGRAVSASEVERYQGLFEHRDIGSRVDIPFILEKISSVLVREGIVLTPIARKAVSNAVEQFKKDHHACEEVKSMQVMDLNRTQNPKFKIGAYHLIALIFLAYHDRAYYSEGVDKKSVLTLFFNGLYLYRRGDNISDSNVDNKHEVDAPVCVEGLLANLLQGLSTFSKGYEIVSITNEDLLRKIPSIVKGFLPVYLQRFSPAEREKHRAAMLKDHVLPDGEFLKDVKMEVKKCLRKEFPDFFNIRDKDGLAHLLSYMNFFTLTDDTLSVL